MLHGTFLKLIHQGHTTHVHVNVVFHVKWYILYEILDQTATIVRLYHLMT